MKKIKSLLAILLAMLMIMSAMPLTAFAESLVDMNGETDKYIWSYTAANNTLYFNIKDEITGDDRVVTDDLNNMLPTYSTQEELDALGDIPLDGSLIHKIIVGNNILDLGCIMFSDDSYPNLNEVVFEENSILDSIISYQFWFSKIKTIEIPQTVKEIDNNAFAYSSLTSITIPESVATVGTGLFEGCTALESVDLSKTSVTNIANNTFDGCTKLTNVSLPKSVNSIGNSAFRETAISSFDFSNITKLGTYAFADCLNLTDVNLSGVKTIHDYAFSYSGIKSADLSNVTTLGHYAFDGCENLTSVNLFGVGKVGTSAFRNTGIKSVEISGTTEIRSSAFADCSSLERVDYNITQQDFIGENTFKNCTNLTEVVLSPYVAQIDSYAFKGCTKLSNIEFPTTVDSEGNTVGLCELGSGVFENTAIKSIKLPSTTVNYSFSGSPIETVDLSELEIDYIPADAFKGCKSLTSFTVPEGYTSIEHQAFKDCTNLSSVTLPDSLLSIDSYTFSNCKSLADIDIPEGVTYIGEAAFENCSLLTEMNIPSGITDISGGLFTGCTNLEKVTSNGTITYIGNEAFYNTKISDLSFAKSVTDVGELAFADCPLITSIAGLTKLETIGMQAFAGCTGLKTTGSLEGVTSIGDMAFEDCSALDTAYIPSTLTSAGKNIYNNSVGVKTAVINSKAMGTGAFYGCTDLETVNIGDACTAIPNSAFADTGIKNVNISTNAKIESIGDSAFKNCTSLTGEFTIPESVKTIGTGAFSGCSGITNFNMPGDTNPLSISSGAFDGCTAFEEFNTNRPVTFAGSSMLKSSIKRLILGGNNAKTLGNYAFKNLSTLEYVKINGDVAINDEAFYGIPTLTNLDLTGANVTFAGDLQFYNSGIEEFVVPSGLTTIPASAFKDSINLRSLVFTSDCSLTAINSCAFYGCDITGELVFPNNLKTISGSAFKNNLHLKKIVLPAATASLGSYAFQNCPLETVVSLNADNTDLSNTSIFYGNNSKFSEGTVMSPITSNLKTFANQYGFNYVAITSDGELVNEVRISGTWSNGEWSVSTNDYEHYNLLISGSGEIDLSSFKDSDGNSITIEQIFSENSDITEITFADGITAVPDRFLCFDETRNYNDSLVKQVNTINLAPSVKRIGAYAFYGIKLQKYTVPETVTELGEYAFSNSYIYDLTITSGLKSVTEYAFYNGFVVKIHINDGVERLEKACFQVKNNITSLDIPSSVKYIHSEGENSVNNAFSYKSNIIHVYGRKSTEGYYFATSHSGIRFHIVIDTSRDFTHPAKYDAAGSFNTTTGTDRGTWYYVEKTKTVYLKGEGMISAYHNFDCAYDVETVVFEKGLTGYSTYAQTILEMTNPSYICYSTSFTALSKDYLRGCTNLKSLIIPDSVTSVDSNLLNDCESLSYIKFGGSMSMVPNEFCKNIKTLTEVDFNDGVSRIGAGAFENCTGLKEINLSYGITKVDRNAFNKCVNVVKVRINERLVDISSKSFGNLAYCEEIEFDSSNLLADINLSTVNWFESFKNLGASTTGTTLRFGNNVTKANLRAFDSVRITEIIIGDNVSSIEDITNLPYLQEVTVSDNNSNYYSWGGALYSNDNCLVLAPSQIDNLEIKQGTVKIGDYAFSNTFIDGITIPSTVNEIGNFAFYNCRELETVDMPNSVTSIGVSAFENCKSLRIFYSPSKLESIGARAFANCTHLGTAVLSSNKLTSIGNEAFMGCSSLIGMVVPETVLTIGDRAYMNCPEMTEIYIWSAKVGTDAFKNDDKLTIFTTAASDAYRYARECNVKYSPYTDENMFFDLCADKVIIYAGYLGYCTDGHGQTQWLTVYEADCENDGYMIGVCEYCSEIIDEKHIAASGHSYSLTADVPATENTKGMAIYNCSKCGDRYCSYTPATGSTVISEAHTVSGSVVLSLNKTATSGKAPAKNVSVVIGGNTVAVTDNEGKFSFELETGTYEAELRYAYGFTRTIYIVVEDSDVEYMNIPIIACDFNKDGKIDDQDYALFNIVISSSANDPSYLDFVDMNNDGYINAKDRRYIRECYGLDATTFSYPVLIIRK